VALPLSSVVPSTFLVNPDGPVMFHDTKVPEIGAVEFLPETLDGLKLIIFYDNYLSYSQWYLNKQDSYL